MKNRSVIFLIILFMGAVQASAAHAGSNRLLVPRVAYIEPQNDSAVDLTGKQSLTFRWKQQPLPSGGRMAVRFRLYKGFSYELVAKENLGRGIFSVDVPADRFEDGKTYSWHVEQRDGSSMLWSLHTTWSFKVIKK